MVPGWSPNRKRHLFRVFQASQPPKTVLFLVTDGRQTEKGMCDSAFIVKLYETYNSAEHLYFLLQLAHGGDLLSNCNNSEGCAKFYVAGTALALEHLHARMRLGGIVTLRHDMLRLTQL